LKIKPRVYLLGFLVPLTVCAQTSKFASAVVTEPSLSPDNSEIAFVSSGHIWTVPAQGGEARLLVSYPATDSRPLYSPDGRQLAFTSTRTGNGDVYVLTLSTGELKRLTYDDANELVEGLSGGLAEDGRHQCERAGVVEELLAWRRSRRQTLSKAPRSRSASCSTTNTSSRG